VEVDVELAVSLLQAFGPIGQTAVKATSITLAAADFGKSTMSVSAPAYDEQNDRLLLAAEFDDGTRHLISYGKDDGIVWSRGRGFDDSSSPPPTHLRGTVSLPAEGSAEPQEFRRFWRTAVHRGLALEARKLSLTSGFLQGCSLGPFGTHCDFGSSSVT
jgi:hypothetical protein